MTKIYYPNCSELIADFNTKDPQMFYDMVSKIGKKHGWIFDPLFSVKILERMKHEDRIRKLGAEDYDNIGLTIVNKKGHHTSIVYGPNGYDDSLGFRFDSGCDHGDDNQYEFFDIAIKECQAEIRSYDGGSIEPFKEWQAKKS